MAALVRADSGGPAPKKKIVAPKNATWTGNKGSTSAARTAGTVRAPSGAGTTYYAGRRVPIRASTAKRAPVAQRTASPAPARLAPAPTNYGGGDVWGGSTGGGGGGISAFSAPAPPPPPPPPPRWEDLSEADQKAYLNSDATYMAQEGSLKQELENLIAELALQRKNYGAEHGNTLRNLGWSQELNAFDPNNALGAYGMAFGNLQDDFASRGMLDSSAFAEGLGNLNTSFNNQLSDINNAKTRFEGELTTREQGARQSHTQDLNRARADAIARRAAKLGLV